MKKILLSLFAVFATVGAWAQATTYYQLGEPTTNLSSGKYAIVCMSDKGTGTAYYHSAGTGRHYRYDLNKSDVTTNSVVESSYVWQVDVLDNGKITIKLLDDQEKFFPKDEAKNKNFAGTEIAELTPEIKTIGGKDYLALKYDDTIGWIHVNSDGGNPNFSYWTSYGDEGTCVKFLFHPVVEMDVENLTYTFTDNAGNEYSGSYDGVKGSSEPTFTGVAGYTLSDKNWNGNKLTATINFPFPVSKEGGKTNATMISNFGASRNKLFADATSVKAILDEEITVSNLSTHLWAIFPEFTEGAFVFTVMNTATGKYIYSESNANSHAEGAVVLSEEASKMTVEGSNRFKLPTGKYLSLNSSTQTQVQYLGTWDAHNGCNLAFPSYAVVSLNEAGYASTYLPFAAALPEGLEAYAVTATSATMATLTALEGIKANQGAILKGAASAEYVLAAGNVTSDWSGNLLQGSATDTEVTGAGYVLSTVNSVTGFYAAKLTDGKFQNNAGKAYLPASAVTAGARFLSFDFGTETAIENIEGAEDAANTVVYDLSGRRVQKTQKGLYIVNGKVVIK